MLILIEASAECNGLSQTLMKHRLLTTPQRLDHSSTGLEKMGVEHMIKLIHDVTV
jgi:hypothetical protein